jgi:hypothetical protein
MVVLFSINELTHRIFLCYGNEFMKREENDFISMKLSVHYFQKMKLLEISIGGVKFYFILLITNETK